MTLKRVVSRGLVAGPHAVPLKPYYPAGRQP